VVQLLDKPLDAGATNAEPELRYPMTEQALALMCPVLLDIHTADSGKQRTLPAKEKAGAPLCAGFRIRDLSLYPT